MKNIILFVDSSEFSTPKFLKAVEKKNKGCKVVLERIPRESVITKKMMKELRDRYLGKLKMVLSDGCMKKRHIKYLMEIPDHQEFEKHWLERWEENCV